MNHDVRELKKIRDALKKAADLRRFRKLDFYAPHIKQKEFHDKGMVWRERLLMAANQCGKTYCGAAEMAFHLTGEYPKWWAGKRFDKPVKAWVCGESSTLVRDGPQRLLCGLPGVDDDFGTGLIPKHLFNDKPALARGVTDAYDTVQVKHKSGGISVATFKSYEQGRQKFQSATLDVVWLDEEPDQEVYQECLARITTTKGILYITFTPLKGKSEVVLRYLDKPTEDRGHVRATLEDTPYVEESEKRKIIEGYLPHQRDARVKGLPMLGSGVIFTMPEEAVTEPAMKHIPEYWAKIWGIDFGIGHPFAAALIAWDKDADVIHVLHAFKISDALPINHAAAMKAIGVQAPVAWPQDGTAREKTSGQALYLQYKAEGLSTLHTHAVWPDGGISTEAGVLEMQQREQNSKLKYAAHLAELLDERRDYHRKDGQIVKERDDILSAIRVAIMMKRFAKPVQLGNRKIQRTAGAIAKGIDFDLF